MLRSMSFVVGAVLCSAQALAASEVDRRTCATGLTRDARIEACTRLLEDQAAGWAMRTMAPRNGVMASAGVGMNVLDSLRSDVELKLNPKDNRSLASRAQAFTH